MRAQNPFRPFGRGFTPLEQPLEGQSGVHVNSQYTTVGLMATGGGVLRQALVNAPFGFTRD
jgi:hypothetical protein